MDTYTRTLYSTTNHYLVSCDDRAYPDGTPLWKVIRDARHHLAARRLIDPYKRAWDRWKVARKTPGQASVEVAVGDHLRVMWQARDSRPRS